MKNVISKLINQSLLVLSMSVYFLFSLSGCCLPLPMYVNRRAARLPFHSDEICACSGDSGMNHKSSTAGLSV